MTRFCLLGSLLLLLASRLVQATSGPEGLWKSTGFGITTAPGSIRSRNATILACSALEAYRANGVATVAQNSSVYTMEREDHWSSTAWEYPYCIYEPNGVQDVVAAVQILKETGAQYAIRGGGHSPLPFWASIDNGVLISMSNINDISYDDAAQTARIGFGNRWGDVYSYLETFGRLAVGGRIAPVGMALNPGGGLSHLSNRYGFSVDNVISYEIVLANATVVTASAISHSDLFFALKGGSNNFGILTHMTLQTYPVGKVWGGLVIYNNSYQDQIMSAFASYQQKGQLDKDSAVLTYLAINNQTVFATYIHFGNTSKPAAFNDFYAIPSVEDQTTLYDNFTDLLDNVNIDYVVPRWTWGTTTFYVDNQTYIDVGRLCAEDSKQMSEINGGSYVLMPQPISQSMIDAANASTPNALGLRSRPQLWFTVNIGWNLPSDDQKAYSILNASLVKIEALTKSRNLYDPFQFLNDASTAQLPIRSYGTTNFEKMKAASRAYDPQGMFQTQVPGGFKLI